MVNKKILNEIFNLGDELNYDIIDAIQDVIKKKIKKKIKEKNTNLNNIYCILDESATFEKIKSKFINNHRTCKNINAYLNDKPNICNNTNKCLSGLKTSFALIELLKFKK